MGKRQKWSWKCLGATAALLALTASFFGCGSDDDDDDDVAVKNVTLSATELSVVKDKENELIATIEPDNASAKTVTWYIGSTEDDLGTKVTVTTDDVEKPNDGSAEGLAISARLKSEDRNRLIITGGAEAGKTVTVTAVAGGQKATCAVTVVAENTLGTVAIAAVNSKNVAITAGSQVENTGTYTLTATVTGNSVTPTYKWESTGEAQEVKQDENNPAKATLTISEADAERTVTVKLTISAEGLTDKTAEFTLKPVAKGAKVTYTATATIEGDAAVVVGSDGTVTKTYTAKTDGNATITKYEWKAEPSDGVTIKANGKTADVTFTNAGTEAATVNLTVTLTTEEGLNGGTNTTVTSTAFPVKVQPKGETVKYTMNVAIGDVASTLYAGNEVTLSATETGNATVKTRKWTVTGATIKGDDNKDKVTLTLPNGLTADAKVTATYTVTTDTAQTLESTSKLTASKELTVKAVTISDITIKAKDDTTNATTGTGSVTLTASGATATNGKDVAYTWEITEGADFASLDQTTGATVTLTGKNETAEAKTVKVTVTATEAVSGATKPKTYDASIAAKVTKTPTIGTFTVAEKAGASTYGTTTVEVTSYTVATASDTVLPVAEKDVTYEYAVTLPTDAAANSVTINDKGVLTNTTTKNITVTVTVTAKATGATDVVKTASITVPATAYLTSVSLTPPRFDSAIPKVATQQFTATAVTNLTDLKYTWKVYTDAGCTTEAESTLATIATDNNDQATLSVTNNTGSDKTLYVKATAKSTTGDGFELSSDAVKVPVHSAYVTTSVTAVTIALPTGTTALDYNGVEMLTAVPTTSATITKYTWAVTGAAQLSATADGTYEDTADTGTTPNVYIKATNTGAETTAKVTLTITYDGITATDNGNSFKDNKNATYESTDAEALSVNIGAAPAKVSKIEVTSVVSNDISVKEDTTNAKKLTATALSGITVATWAWYVDGADQNNATESLDLSTSTLSTGYHYVTVTATTAAGVTYSAQATVTVIAE